MSRSYALLIPAWQPDSRLTELLHSLSDAPFSAIIIVNDGSDPDREPIFEQAASGSRVVVLRHATNRGKGRALKTGLEYFRAHFPHLTGVVTCDADGQHSAEDIRAVAQALSSGSSRLVIGSRQFKDHVPWRSRFGNFVTRYVFAGLTGKKLADTQTGLRGVPASMVPRLLQLDGERYEYEMNMLADAARSTGIVEVPVRAIYYDGNRSSHFNPFWDSMKIYFVLARFYISSLAAAAIDFVVFSAVFWMTGNVLVSMIAGRVSSLANFAMNRRFVFNNGGRIAATLARYYALVVLIATASYAGIRLLTETLGVNVLLAKVVVETSLSLASFAMQRAFVFGSAPAAEVERPVAASVRDSA